MFHDTRVVAEADPASFEFLGGRTWARDKSHVFFQSEIIRGPDPATARVVGNLLVDAAAVYSEVYGKVIAGLDPATLEHLGCCFYRDKSRVFFRIIPQF